MTSPRLKAALDEFVIECRNPAAVVSASGKLLAAIEAEAVIDSQLLTDPESGGNDIRDAVVEAAEAALVPIEAYMRARGVPNTTISELLVAVEAMQAARGKL